jgi:hypothetical protein
LPGFVKEGFKGLVDAAVAPKFDMDLEMVFESDGKPGRLQVRRGYDCATYGRQVPSYHALASRSSIGSTTGD